MDTKVNFTIVGLFVVLLSAALIVIVLWLSSFSHRNKVFDTYIVYMHEDVAGLGTQSAVRFNGVKVGYVKSLRLNDKDPQLVVLTLAIEKDVPITTSTVATIQSEGLTGSDYVGLKGLTAQAPKLIAKPGEKYPVIVSEPSLLLKLSTALEKVTKTVTDLGQNVNKLFDDKNRKSISHSLANLDKLTTTLVRNSDNINAAIVSLKIFLKNGATASREFPSLIKKLQTSLDSIQLTASEFARTGKQATHTLDTTHIMIQNLSSQLLPSAQQLMDEVNATMTNVNSIIDEMQHNPSILVRGKYPQPPGPGESRK